MMVTSSGRDLVVARGRDAEKLLRLAEQAHLPRFRHRLRFDGEGGRADRVAAIRRREPRRPQRARRRLVEHATRRGFEPAAQHAEIEGVTFHSMRHAFASRMIDRGISSTVLARLMGHESSTITERRYIHLFDKERTDETVRRAMRAS